jgi:hypothetical protein
MKSARYEISPPVHGSARTRLGRLDDLPETTCLQQQGLMRMAHPRSIARWAAVCMLCALCTTSTAAAPNLMAALRADPELATMLATVEKSGLGAALLQDASLQVPYPC